MLSKRKTIFSILALFFFIEPAIVYAQPAITPKTMAQRLRNLYPDKNFKEVNTTPVPGIFEVTVGQAVNYVDSTGRYFFGGPLIDLKDNINLSSLAVEKASRIDVKMLALEDALKIVKGKGTQTIYVFSDPDCPYCKQLESNFESLDDTTIYLFLYPLVDIHPQAAAKSVGVWCAAHPTTAWRNLMIEGKDPAGPNCSNPVDRNLALGGSLGVNVTPTIFFEDGMRLEGVHLAIEVYAKASARNRLGQRPALRAQD